jgi:hypothetical protein
VLRGGSYWNEPQNCAVANRNDNDPANRNNNYGFRLLLQLAASGKSRTKQVNVLLPSLLFGTKTTAQYIGGKPVRSSRAARAESPGRLF